MAWKQLRTPSLNVVMRGLHGLISWGHNITGGSSNQIGNGFRVYPNPSIMVIFGSVVLAWKLWERPNKAIKGEEESQVLDLVAWCKSYLATYRTTQFRPNESMQPAHPSVWIPSPVGVIKINFDTAVIQGQCEFSIGLVARNSDDICIYWRQVKVRGKLSPVEGEAMAALKAIELARSKGWRSVAFEGDNIQVIAGLHEGNCFSSTWGAVIEDCVMFVRDFAQCSFQFVKRGGNVLAHAVAKLLCNQFSEGSSFPPHLIFSTQ